MGITLGNTGIYWVKVKIGLSPKIMKEIWDFQENETFIVKSGNNLSQRNMQTIQYVTESISNLGAKILDLLPEEINMFSNIKLENGSLKNVLASFFRQ